MSTGAPLHRWFKSSYSGGANNECVEVRFGAVSGEHIGVRDSKSPESRLSFSSAAFSAFLLGQRR
ncbi:DUF397 domain-containing protein [Actinosynnema pretiosum subsp. pretiosum]|uniref:DUF397 domain-containing protein n=2 Tax=Actinosynnema TaxID=40566 RepID=C6WMC9_ACTMD|nr:DUF397 domain-containing protein [Actinosynnema mirum]ACU34863.1 protein of unknown function DUF397 [Actinosynnema mirum DSM 43827]QUF07403.1 DUF397 domain-containing protein [Actinosynnema pretiosum subsp. pretiosum]